MNTLNACVTGLLAIMIIIQGTKENNLEKIKTIKWNDLLGKILYNSIYLYSKVQLVCIKLRKKIHVISSTISSSSCKLLRKYNFMLPEQNMLGIEMYNLGNLHLCKKINYTALYKINSMIQEIKNYIKIQPDIIVYSDLQNDKKVNKICYKELTNYLNYEISNIKFLALLISYRDKNDILIELSTEEYNYYIVNNTIDKFFVLYFIKNILKDNSIDNPVDFKYTITLYDENATISTLNETDIITINQSDYSITKSCESSDEFVIT